MCKQKDERRKKIRDGTPTHHEKKLLATKVFINLQIGTALTRTSISKPGLFKIV